MSINALDKKILMRLQEGLSLNAKPYEELAFNLGVTELEVLDSVRKLNEEGFLKRIDFRLDLKKIGIESTLVGCKVPKEQLEQAKNVISSCKNVTHNYLRKHDYNMWFTLSAGSLGKMKRLLSIMRERINSDDLVSFRTKNILKLGFRLNAK